MSLPGANTSQTTFGNSTSNTNNFGSFNFQPTQPSQAIFGNTATVQPVNSQFPTTGTTQFQVPSTNSTPFGMLNNSVISTTSTLGPNPINTMFGSVSQPSVNSLTMGGALGNTQPGVTSFGVGASLGNTQQAGVASFGNSSSFHNTSIFGSGATTSNTSSPFGSTISTTTAITSVALPSSSGEGIRNTAFTASTSGFGFNSSSAVTSKPLVTSSNNISGGLGFSNLQQPSISTSSNVVSGSTLTTNQNIDIKKGLGGTPLTGSSSSTVKSEVALNEGVKHAKDLDLQPELKETFDQFKKYLSEIKKNRDDIMKSNELDGLLEKVKEEIRNLSHSICDVTNGLQMIQIQSSKVKYELNKEQSNIKIAQLTPDNSSNFIDQNASIRYLSTKTREFENRLSQYIKEVEDVEAMMENCNTNSQNSSSTWTPRELVGIIRRIEDDFISVAADLYVLNERVRLAKVEFLRQIRISGRHNEFQDPFKAVEGRFSDPFESEKSTASHRTLLVPKYPAITDQGINQSSNQIDQQVLHKSTRSNRLRLSSDGVGSSPFEHCRYISQQPHNQTASSGTQPGSNANNSFNISNNSVTANASAFGGGSNLFGGLQKSFTNTTNNLNGNNSLFGTEFSCTARKRR